MGHDGDHWTEALAEARLSAEEEELLARARDEDPSLGDELTFLVAHLRANLSGEFLRALVDNLRTGLDPELSVLCSLRQTIATSTLLIDLRRPGGSGG